MRGALRAAAVCAVVSLLDGSALTAGVYLGIVRCIEEDGTCYPGFLKSIAPDGNPFPAQPFGIVHPLGYTGLGGEVRIRVCTSTGGENDRLVLPTARAIATWNQLLATTENCSGCRLWEDTEFPGLFHAETALLHELGHCAMGLGHPNLDLEVPDGVGFPGSSYTAAIHSARAGISPGMDAIRGSHDDGHLPFPTLALHGVHYFRVADNNPVVVDATVIDGTSYSRAQMDLPEGHTWAANANKNVAAALGAPNTQAVMYSLQSRDSRQFGLTADEVNMVRYGMTGLDTMVGGGDDYTIVLEFQETCGGADIQIFFGETVGGALGQCSGGALDFTDGTPSTFDRHYSVVPAIVLPLQVVLNDEREWDTGGPDLVIEVIASGGTPGPGDPVSYSIGVENVGNGDAAGVVVMAAVPDGTTFDAGTSDPGWSCGAGALGVANATTVGSMCSFSVGAVPALGQAGPWTFAVLVNDPTTVADVVQTASVGDDGANGPDENPEDNAVTTVTAVDVPCGGMQDLVLTTADPELVVVHEACNSISAGLDYVVSSTQAITFKARNLISLGAGFGIESGGEFAAEIDPLAGQLP